MTDKEFIEMSRLLDSLTKGADTLRDLFPGKVTEKVRSHPQFKVRWALLRVALKGYRPWRAIGYRRGAQ